MQNHVPSRAQVYRKESKEHDLHFIETFKSGRPSGNNNVLLNTAVLLGEWGLWCHWGLWWTWYAWYIRTCSVVEMCIPFATPAFFFRANRLIYTRLSGVRKNLLCDDSYWPVHVCKLFEFGWNTHLNLRGSMILIRNGAFKLFPYCYFRYALYLQRLYNDMFWNDQWYVLKWHEAKNARVLRWN